MKYPHLATRLYNVPLLIAPSKGEVIEAVFRAYSEGRETTLPSVDKAPTPKQRLLSGPVSLTPTDSGYGVTTSGVAVIPIYGALVQRGDEFDAMSGLTGYNTLAQQLEAALSDRSVRGIMLDIDSPGGEAAGVSDLAQQIRDASSEKLIYAFANEMALSAAYWLASAAQKLLMPTTGVVGSIGVIAYHLDASQAESKRGYTFTPIYAGERKADFSSHAPLSTAAKAAAQEQVDELYANFRAAVTKYRKIPDARVRDTEAGLLHAKTAVHDGFADDIATFADSIAMLAEEVKPKQFSFGPRAERAISTGVTAMAEKDKEVAAARDEGFAAGKAEGMNAGLEAGKKEGLAAGKAEVAAEASKAAAAAQARVVGILTHAEAAGRTKLAEHLAKSPMSLEEAVATLAAAPKEAAAATPTNLLADAMGKLPNPKVGAGGGEDGEEDAVAVGKRMAAMVNKPKLAAVK